MPFPAVTYVTDADAFSGLRSNANYAGLQLGGQLSTDGMVASILANLLVNDPSTVSVPAGDVTSGLFGANIPDTGAYGFPTRTYYGVGTTSGVGLKRSATQLQVTLGDGTVGGTLGMGTTPGTSGAINVDASSYSNHVLRGINGTSVGFIDALSGWQIGTTSNDPLRFYTRSIDRWQVLDEASGTATLNSDQATARIVGGSTNGLAVRNSANTRDNWLVDDAGNVATLRNAAGAGQVTLQSTTGEITAAIWIQGSSGFANSALMPNSAAGNKAYLGYNNQTSWLSGAEVASVASGFGTLSLMKSGGGVTVGDTAPWNSAIAALRVYGSSSTLGGAIQLFSQAASGQVAWQIAQATTSNTLTFIPSTAADGTTFTNQCLSISNGGSVRVGLASGTGQFVVDGTAFGAATASVRLNGLTSGAAAQVGTLTNAPTAGNPNFWIPISIAGTVRYLPAW